MQKLPPPKFSDIQKKQKQIIAKYDFNKDGCIGLKEFQSFVTKDPDILKCLYYYGLISQDELKEDFGSGGFVPECDSDLENEM